MRCPKCHYISFDSGDRCRNCGYEFSLAVDTDSLDLPIQTGQEPEGPFADFSLDNLDDATPGGGPGGAAPAATASDPQAAGRITQSFDLPLFRDRAGDDDRPLVSAPAVPRAPLSVRKTSLVSPRPAGRREAEDTPRLDLAPGALRYGETSASSVEVMARRRVQPSTEGADAVVVASAGARLLAALIDGLLLGAIDLAVLHFTLKLCYLEYAEMDVLPMAPFVAFLLMLNGGYVTAFTAAGGQSIGKMATGIKVVPSDTDAWSDRVPLGQAVLRAVAYLVSALPAGLGFLPALFGGEKRALHDRLAHTRVVKA